MTVIAKTLIASPVIIVLISAARLLFVSNYDTTVATTIASAGGVTGTLVGTVIPLLPPYLPVAVIGLMILRRWLLASIFAIATALLSPSYMPVRDAAEGAWGQFVVLLEGVHAVFSSEDMRQSIIDMATNRDLLPSYIFMLAWALFFALFAFHAPQLKNAAPSDRVAPAFKGFIGGLFMAFFMTTIIFFGQHVFRVPFSMQHFSDVARDPWVPAEEIALSTGEVHVGYTISSNEGWLLVLFEEDRNIDYIESDEIEDRSICTPNGHGGEFAYPIIALRGSGDPGVKNCRNS